MARTFRNFTDSPDIQRQRQVAELLRQQGSQPMQGQMVSGHYVPPSWSQGLNQLFQGYASGQLANQADETESRRNKELAQALRGGMTTTQAPGQDVSGMGGQSIGAIPGQKSMQEQPLVERLSGLENNPRAQQMAMALRLREATQEPAKPMVVNGKLIDPSNPSNVLADYSEPKAPGKLIQNEQGQWVPNPALMQYEQNVANAGRTSIDLSNFGGASTPELGKLSTDYGYVRDPETGQPVIDKDTGLPRAAPVPGSKEYRDMQKSEEQDKSKQAQAERYADVVTEDIDRALNIVEESTIPTTGFGSYLSAVPGTPARDLLGLVDTIRANVGFDRLQQMRDASPTGGALGQVSELENRLLQATLGNLELSQSEKQFKRNLGRVKDIYTEIINEGIPEEKAQEKLKDVIQSRPDSDEQTDQVPEGIDPEDWKFMTPEEKELFQ